MKKNDRNMTEEYFYDQQVIPEMEIDLEPYEEETVEAERSASRMGDKAKALVLFFAAVAVFLCAVSMCFVLVSRSAEVAPLPVVKNVQPMKYVVNLDQPENADKSADYAPPASRYESDLLNFMIFCVDSDRSETFMMLSLNLSTKQMAVMSFPRDTYIFGAYETPVLRNVYSEHASSGRGVQALTEMIKGQIGYDPDYYLVLDEASLEEIFEITGDIEFEVPESPNYSGVDAGWQSVGSWSALKLLSCKNSYYYVETESTQVQRNLLVTLLAALAQRCENVEEDMTVLKSVMDTNLSFEELAYLMYFLRGVDFSNVPSVCLPGTIIEIEGREYFQVDEQGACDVLNAYFNPLQKELTIHNVAFRDQQGAPDEGEWEDYKDYIVTTPTTTAKPTTKPTSNTDSPTETQSPVTEAPTPPTMPEGPDTPHDDP